jgi:hypothetical protein
MELWFATSPSPNAFEHFWVSYVTLFLTSVFTVKFGRNAWLYECGLNRFADSEAWVPIGVRDDSCADLANSALK